VWHDSIATLIIVQIIAMVVLLIALGVRAVVGAMRDRAGRPNS
jgi:hypothetical protein